MQIQGGDLSNRIISEKNNPQADMVFGLNAMEYEKLKNEEVIDKWEPEWKDQVDMSLGDEDGYYYPIVIQPLVNIMNADIENPPADVLVYYRQSGPIIYYLKFRRVVQEKHYLLLFLYCIQTKMVSMVFLRRMGNC